MIENIGKSMVGMINMLNDSPIVAIHLNHINHKADFRSIDKIMVGTGHETFTLPINGHNGGNISPEIFDKVMAVFNDRLKADDGRITVLNNAVKTLISLYDKLSIDKLASIRCTYTNASIIGFIEGCNELFSKEDGISSLHKLPDQRIVDLTLQLYNRQVLNIESHNLETIARSEHALIPLLLKMQYNGIRVDSCAIGAFQDHIDEAERNARSILPDKFNEQNSKDVLTALGLESKERVPLPVNVGVDHLMKSEVGRAIHELRVIRGYRISLTSLIKDIDEHGFVHPNWTSISYDRYGSFVGRMYCSNPNLQNIPRNVNDDGTPNVKASLYRSIFIPSSEDNVFVEFDYNAFELRIIANLTKDEGLINLFTRGNVSNPYAKFAEILGVKSVHQAKKFLIGFNHGFSVRTMAAQLNVPYRKIKDYVANTIEPLVNMRRRYEELAKGSGQVVTPTGRIIPCTKPHLAWSRLLQAHGADMLKVKVRSLVKRDYNVVMMNHDSIVVELGRSKTIQREIDDIKYALENFSGASVRMATKYSVANSFNF